MSPAASGKSLIAALLLFCATGTWAAAEEPAPKVGTIDLAVVRALHPLNRYRVAEAGLTLRPAEFRAPEELARIGRERDEAQRTGVAAGEAELDRLRKREGILRQRVRVIAEEVEAGKRDLKGQYAIEYALPESKERDRRLAEIKRDLRRIDEQIGYRSATAEAEIRAGQAQMRKIKERVFAINYLLPDEVRTMRETVDRDLNEALRKICAARRLLTVINRAALAGRDDGADDPVEAHWRTPNATFPNLFYIARDESDFADQAVDPAALADFAFRVGEALGRTCAGGAGIRLDELVVYGETDVTAAAIEEIQRKCGYPKNRVAATTAAVEGFMADRKRGGK